MSSSSPLRWTLREIARLERGIFRPVRLTEPTHERWHRVRRKLGWVAFIDLLHEDLATPFPAAFALDRWLDHPTINLGEDQAKALIDEACKPDDTDRLVFLREVCHGLGLVDGGSLGNLPKVQAHQSVLELPGCGGRIAAHKTLHDGLAFDGHFSFVADSDAERVAIGIAAAEFGAQNLKIISSKDLREGHLRFDHVFGLRGYPAAERLAEDLPLEVRWA